jgi:PIN domain nuclease of toxin-antitoxin system
MKLLLDTHVFLWFISGDERLPDIIMLICQAMQHGLTIATVDDVICSYSIPVLARA